MNMPLDEVFANLCTKDARNPVYYDIYGDDEDKPIPRDSCSCDNCFYGRDKLAMEIIRLQNLVIVYSDMDKL
jgi:hypothetical protein